MKGKPLFSRDVWEHAYPIDYRNAHPPCMGKYRNLVACDFVANNVTM
ncbi:MAG: Fe-Mn family superoxide dismutase [Sphaerochaetaceae bacterium]